ncbi:acyl-CoA thioesterase [Macrococcus sp. DPC7161]|uniref:acyl-CoA thioesterase n=1 Tax=Macrococcus sp. DPC7161 TaxID=2507060 RepID=UPI00100B86D5|nr:acyl-CoA thioesterase [Macrococcus sp. DPC7161]RXK17750.1 acyl-CoA thioesterase [Macrococcus sp. DPC7161]
MTERLTKTMQASKSTKTTQIFPGHTNHHHTLFGGKLMAEIDDIASIAATRHSERPVVTASSDALHFLAPVRSGEILNLVAMVTHTGTSSMEICTKVYKENPLTTEKTLAAISFLTFVALGSDQRPTEVPLIIAETEEEAWLIETGAKRAEQRKASRNETKALVEHFTKMIQ